MKRLSPGVYDDERGGLHIDLPAFLHAHGYADTPDHRAKILEAIGAVFPGKVVETDYPIAPQNEPKNRK